MQLKRVLCVEDDADTRDMLKFKLGLSDIEAVVAPDVDAALRLLEREQFSAAEASTPIVIFSGHSSASDIQAGLHAGANAYLVKPDSSRLIPTIRRLLGVVEG
jgi:DNA-binding response OmpR family regulator